MCFALASKAGLVATQATVTKKKTDYQRHMNCTRVTRALGRIQ